MSNQQTQFMNQVLIEEDRRKEHERKHGLTVFSLKRKYFERFRPNFEQGVVFECFIPIFFFYTFGTFNLDWVPLENALIAYAIVAFAYFRFVTIFDRAWLLWLAVIGYFSYKAFFTTESGSWYRLANFVPLAFTMEAVPSFFRGQFCVGELFVLATINAYYVSFCLDSVIYQNQREFIAGCNITNLVSFSPWLFLNLSGVIAYVMGQIYRVVGPIGGHDVHVALGMVLSAVGGFGLTLVCLGQFGSVHLLFSTVFKVM